MSETRTIGCVGGGQLIRMEIEEARRYDMPLDFVVVENSLDCPASQVGARVVKGALTDMDAIGRMADMVDVMTWEIEHIPAGYICQLALRGHNVQPHPQGLWTIQDKLRQKEHFIKYRLPVAPFMAIENEEDLVTAKQKFGDVIVKTRKGGYDGRGNLVLNGQTPTEVLDSFKDDAGQRLPIYAEQKLPFERELAIIAARSKKGEVATYPLVETIHSDNICNIVMAPALGSEKLQTQADELAHEALRGFEGAGVWAFELFDHDQNLVINEVAPRVHNSGHLTIEANEISQFRQHLLAVTGQKLGSTALKVPAAAMVNILGTKNLLDRQSNYTLGEEDVAYARLRDPEANIHVYGKAAREARKVGHITICAADAAEARRRAEKARARIAA